MGGCNFSWCTYAYADAEEDVELSTFALQPEDTDYKVLSDPEAAQYVSGIGVHWYGDLYTVPERLTQTHDLFPDYFILGTEACEEGAHRRSMDQSQS
ncbi:putative glucosylceramidase 2 [Penaeus vannamei]|uniref:putative glucosylceramidase 2 n=1 Tax=Penaeus vannamei TaxID=6689 RepID=UPI00387F6098